MTTPAQQTKMLTGRANNLLTFKKGEKMYTSTDLIEGLQAKHGGVSAYRVAQIYGWGNGRVLNWKSGRACPNPKECIRIANELDISAAHIVACMDAQRQSDPEIAEVYAVLAELSV